MQKQFIISITLDQRRKKKNGTFPVRLRVFMPEIKKQKLYPTVFNFTEQEFSSIWKSLKVKQEYKFYRLQLSSLENKANEVASGLSDFTFEDFERLMFGSTGAKRNVNYYFKKISEDFYCSGSISTAICYDNAISCIKRYCNKENIDFKDVTINFLNGFENFCLKKENKSITTVSIYLRTLRAVFNKAIADKVISPEIYPFGKGKYQIKSYSKTKKALSEDLLKILFLGKPEDELQERSKSFWFFSYLCNGMNFKDILNLKCKDVDSEKITFIREKTKNTTHEVKPIEVYLNDFTREVINRYGNLNQSPNGYVFPIFNKEMSDEELRKAKLNFIDSTNDHFNKYAKALGIEENITTYWARHTFSTIAIRKGMSIEFVGEALGHTDIKTTMNYFKGFEKESKQKISNILLDF